MKRVSAVGDEGAGVGAGAWAGFGGLSRSRSACAGSTPSSWASVAA
jgi:hypothetical protein